jgi:hypothetical protein
MTLGSARTGAARKSWQVWIVRALAAAVVVLVALPVVVDAFGPPVGGPAGSLRINGLEGAGLLASFALVGVLLPILLPISSEPWGRCDGDLLILPTVLGERRIRLSQLSMVRGLVLVPALSPELPTLHYLE